MPSVLKKINFIPFEPFPFFKTGHAQTILSQFFPYIPVIKSNIKHHVKLTDKDTIVLVENPPQVRARKSNRIIILVHGLTGSQDSSYMQRGAHYLTQAGFRVFRMNLRGCGAGFHHATRLYHSGRSQDAQEIISWLSQRYPSSPITLVGFSLGANLVLKLAGELGRNSYKAPNLDSVLAVSPPLNLETSVKLLLHKQNHFFNNYFVKRLVHDINAKRNFIPTLPLLSPHQIKTVLDFDEQVTAPHNGFKNAKDYYQQSSSGQYIHAITLPTLILHAKDDPFIGNAEFYRLPQKSNLDLLMTKNGGHVSWLGKTDQLFNFRWMDRVILKWINWIDNQSI
jgi:predicted alpha/beta-fold hydrolase